MTTVIICNPMGTDVTPYVNGTPYVPQLLRGHIMVPGDTVYTLPYVNLPGIANINAGVAMLDTKIRATSGNILLFGYSEGCQVIDKWINDNYLSPPVPSNRLSVLCIGNANSPHGGIACGRSSFAPYAYTAGLPATVPWPYTMFSRQYDPIGDFPTDSTISTALNSILNPSTIFTGLAQLWSIMTKDSNQWFAAQNAYFGLSLVHDFYLAVAPGDAVNRSHTDASGVKYELALTYPPPILGLSDVQQGDDIPMRAAIEACYSRPMATPPVDYTKPYGGAAQSLYSGAKGLGGYVTWKIGDDTLEEPWIPAFNYVWPG